MPPHVTCSGIHKPQVTGITVAYYVDNGSGGESLNPPEPYKDNLFVCFSVNVSFGPSIGPNPICAHQGA